MINNCQQQLAPPGVGDGVGSHKPIWHMPEMTCIQWCSGAVVQWCIQWCTPFLAVSQVISPTVGVCAIIARGPQSVSVGRPMETTTRFGTSCLARKRRGEHLCAALGDQPHLCPNGEMPRKGGGGFPCLQSLRPPAQSGGRGWRLPLSAEPATPSSVGGPCGDRPAAPGISASARSPTEERPTTERPASRDPNSQRKRN